MKKEKTNNKEIIIRMTAIQPISQKSGHFQPQAFSEFEKMLNAEAEKEGRGKKEGRVSVINKLCVATPKGPVNIPVISANSVRGHWRKLAADHLLQTIGYEYGKMTKALYYLLYSGGSLDKDIKTPFELLENIIEFRSILPYMSLLGCSFGNKMIEGKMKPDFVYPHILETMTLLNIEDENASDLLTAKQIVGEIMHTRKDDYIETKDDIEKDKLDKAKKKTAKNTDKDKDEDKDNDVVEKKAAQQQIYHDQYIIAGTEFTQNINILQPTEIEISCCFSMLDQFVNKKPYIGGMLNKGFGRIRLKVYDLKKNEIDINEESKKYNTFLDDNKEKINEYLDKLTKEYLK
jgi:CRISPR type IV-associated protein Csf2